MKIYNDEYNDGQKMVKNAIKKSKTEGWTQDLKEKLVLGNGMMTSALYHVNTIIQNFIIGKEGWNNYTNEITWEQFINEEFEKVRHE